MANRLINGTGRGARRRQIGNSIICRCNNIGSKWGVDAAFTDLNEVTNFETYPADATNAPLTTSGGDEGTANSLSFLPVVSNIPFNVRRIVVNLRMTFTAASGASISGTILVAGVTSTSVSASQNGTADQWLTLTFHGAQLAARSFNSTSGLSLDLTPSLGAGDATIKSIYVELFDN